MPTKRCSLRRQWRVVPLALARSVRALGSVATSLAMNWSRVVARNRSRVTAPSLAPPSLAPSHGPTPADALLLGLGLGLGLWVKLWLGGLRLVLWLGLCAWQ